METTMIPERPPERFYVETASARYFQAWDRVTGCAYALVRDARGLRIYEDGARVPVPENVPQTAADFYAYASERRRFALLTGRLLDDAKAGVAA